MTTITPTALAAELAAATPPLNEEEQHLALTLYRLLADGRPVDRALLASRANLPPEQVEESLSRWPGVYRDDNGCVIGFWGLSQRPTAHQLLVDDHVLYAWCAWDTLFLAELLQKPVKVQSTCPTTGERISLSVNPDEITDVTPAGTVLSFLHREQRFDTNTIATFCHYIHFFASRAAAEDWTAQHNGTFVISLTDGTEIAQLTNDMRLPAVLFR
jgi:alkylmercury lyase